MTGTAAAAGPRRGARLEPPSGARSRCAPSSCAKATPFAASEPEPQVSARGAPPSAVPPQLCPRNPTASSSTPGSTQRPSLSLLSCPPRPSVPSHLAFLESELGGGKARSSGGVGRTGRVGTRRGHRVPRGAPLLRVLVLTFLKSVSGNSLELGFSRVYLEADVILCQAQGTGDKNHTCSRRLPSPFRQSLLQILRSS